ncbi:Hypothetical predicted protein [Marmota monax]|uniref:Homeobox domain-containing protein n=1 Tax=Marmota monax TaxID=9995 RepID=A0A5E4CWG7_MARMO|nr:hypothetical protein GHT09_005777 [Marmota monax]VTJ86188.1 Hypothetical predicted protein [Marmota monax]
MDAKKRIRRMLGPLASRWNILILSMQQMEKLKEHFLKDPFPSHSTLVALASRLGLEEQHVQDWFRMQRWIRNHLSRGSRGHIQPGQASPGNPPPGLTRSVHVHLPKVPTPAAQEAPEAPAFRARPVRTSRRVPRRVSPQQPFPRGPGSWWDTARIKKPS